MDALSTPSADLPFANDALRLLAEAQSEAARLRHEYVGTEHLVLAMTRPPTSPSAAIMEFCGVDPNHVHASLVEIATPQAEAVTDERPFTSRTKRAFDLAADSARELGHGRVKSVHLLVGIMREAVNVGAQVLSQCGLTPEGAQEGTRLIVANGNAP